MIKKAVIAAAGLGTRMFPITKVIQKEMLPVLNRPVIDYIVQDCIEAGIEEIIFVVNNRNNQIQKYFSEDKKLYKFLKNRNSLEKYQQIKDLHSLANFKFITQKESDGYGTAVPLRLAEKYLKNDYGFLFLSGDDIIANQGESHWLKEFITTFNNSDSLATITIVEKDRNELNKYGIIKFKEEKNVKYLEDLIEKPKIEDAPSNFANISKYILTPTVFEILKTQKINPTSGEFYVTDTILSLLKYGKVSIYNLNGKYFDVGNVESWLETNMFFAKKMINTQSSN